MWFLPYCIKTQHSKMKITASSPITSQQIDGKRVEAVLGSSESKLTGQHEWELPNITIIDTKMTRRPSKEDCAAHLQDLKWTASSGFISASESSLVQSHILPEAACLWWGCERSTIASQADSHGQYLSPSSRGLMFRVESALPSDCVSLLFTGSDPS